VSPQQQQQQDAAAADVYKVVAKEAK